MIGATGTAMARRAVLKFMRSTIVITRQGTEIYDGRCSFRAAEANQGQLSEPDPVEADTGSYQSYDIWIPHRAADVFAGDQCEITTEGRTIDLLTITAVEDEASHKTAMQLRAVKQRTSSPLVDIVLIREDYDTGEKEKITAQKAQVVLEGSKAINAGAQVTGGSQAYIQGTLVFQLPNADVLAGDRFRYEGRWGEVVGVAAFAYDRTEATIRIPGGGFD